MTRELAIRSLKDDFVRTFFYGLTIALTSMLLFLINMMSMSDTVGVTLIGAGTDLPTTITLVVGCAAFVIISFANDFYVKNKSQSLAVQLISGGTFTHLAGYLLIQTAIIIVIGIAAGILLAICLMPVMNHFLTQAFGTDNLMHVSSQAVIGTCIALLFVIIYSTYLNVAYVYRNTIKNLLEQQDNTNRTDIPFMKTKIMKLIMRVIMIVLYLLPVFMFFKLDLSWTYVMALPGLFGLYYVIDIIVGPMISKFIKTKKINQPVTAAWLGLFREDIKVLRSSFILLLFGDMLFLSFVIMAEGEPVGFTLSIISFTVMNILLALSIMFKYSSVLAMRTKAFRTLRNIGFTRKFRDKIMNREVLALYLFILLIGLLYLVPLLISGTIQNLFSVRFAVTILLIFAVPVILCGSFNLYYYRRSIIIDD